jgi:hypothetical protein
METVFALVPELHAWSQATVRAPAPQDIEGLAKIVGAQVGDATVGEDGLFYADLSFGDLSEPDSGDPTPTVWKPLDEALKQIGIYSPAGR